MGGRGSGNWKKNNCKRLVEDSLKINVGVWQRTRRLGIGTSFIHEWFDTDGTLCGEAQVLACGNSLLISYMLGQEEITNTICIEWIACLNFYRAFFICPDCGRRVADLYLGKKLFSCRHCSRLGYKSQRNSR